MGGRSQLTIQGQPRQAILLQMHSLRLQRLCSAQSGMTCAGDQDLEGGFEGLQGKAQPLRLRRV